MCWWKQKIDNFERGKGSRVSNSVDDDYDDLIHACNELFGSFFITCKRLSQLFAFTLTYLFPQPR